MKLFTQVLTFGSTPVQVVAANCSPVCNVALTNVAFLSVTSLAANSHPSYVGTPTVTNDASGTGVLTQLPTPVSGVISTWQMTLAPNRIDLTQIFFHGTSGEKIVVGFVVED